MTFTTKEKFQTLGRGLAIALLAGVILGGCAGVPADPDERAAYYEENDPIQPVNRAVFKFNKGLDSAVLKPVATVYRDFLPQLVRDGIRNFLNNLRSPVVLANNLLQGDLDGAQTTIARFMVNTFFGFGGIGDPAEDLGAKRRNEDFGQTLAVWGVGEGPYLMLPVFGPSNPRDVIGLVVDTLIDPLDIYADNVDEEEITVARFVALGIDKRSRNIKTLDDLEKSSLDFYATIRSLYRQIRNDDIRNGKFGDAIPSPSITLDDSDSLFGPRAQLDR